MKFSYNWLKEFVPDMPKPEKIAELLTTHSFEVESILKQGNDWALDIDILPNRMGDAASHGGVAREIAAIINAKIKNPARTTVQPVWTIRLDGAGGQKLKNNFHITIEEPELCPQYIAAVIGGVTIKESPQWMQKRLRACGVKPINNVVDTMNYVMLEIGQPLHVFDKEKIEGGGLVVRMAKKGERIATLDGEEKILGNTLVIADAKGPVAIAGIKGGERTGVSDSTKTVVIESANFNPLYTRASARALGLLTDAAIRFSAGIEEERQTQGIERAVQLVQQLAGGMVDEVITRQGKKQTPSHPIHLRVNYANSLLGAELKEKEMRDILTRIGCVIRAGFLATPPAWRHNDLQSEEDLIEEIGRLYGYDRIEPASPFIFLAPAHTNENHFFEETIRDALQGLGAFELNHYVFSPQGDVALANPAHKETGFLKSSLLDDMVRAVCHNACVSPYFEIGAVFHLTKNGEGVEETLHLMIGMRGDFYTMKGIVWSLLEGLGFTDMWVDDVLSSKDNEWPLAPRETRHPARSALIKMGDETAGSVFEIHPEYMRKKLLEGGNIVIGELLMPCLAELFSAEKEYRPVSRYPAVERDIAVLVPWEERMDRVEEVIEIAGGDLLSDTDLVDFYEGEQIPEGKKSLAFRCVFQSPDRTLRDEEVNAAMNAIYKAVTKRGWEVR